MQPYEKLIYEGLKGETPKEKYENLISMQLLLQQIAFPKRGTEQEHWNIYDVCGKAAQLIDQHENYEQPK